MLVEVVAEYGYHLYAISLLVQLQITQAQLHNRILTTRCKQICNPIAALILQVCYRAQGQE